MRKLLDYAVIEQPAQKAPAIALPECTPRLIGYWAGEAQRMMEPGETPEALFIRLMLFYQHANRQDSDTALVAAMERVTGH